MEIYEISRVLDHAALSPQTGVDAGGDTKGYKKSACEKFFSVSKIFDVEGCLNFVLCLSSCIYK